MLMRPQSLSDPWASIYIVLGEFSPPQSKVGPPSDAFRVRTPNLNTTQTQEPLTAITAEASHQSKDIASKVKPS